MKIFQKGNILMSTFLNIIGLTFAFATLYIIIVQVHYNLTYNNGIKDSERIYILAVNDWFEEGKYGTNVNRVIPEGLIRFLPSVERGGLIEPLGYDNLLYLSEDSDPVIIKISEATLAGVETIGYEAIEGSWKDWNDNSIAISQSLASALKLHPGDNIRIGSPNSSEASTNEFSIALIYKDLPQNSDFSMHNAIINFGDNFIDNYSEWSFNYYIKFNPDVSEDEINASLNNYLRKFLTEENKISAEDAEELISQSGYRVFSIHDSYFNPVVKSPGRKGNKTTTFTLLAIALLIIIIAFINYFNFFFAMIPMKLRDVNIRKVLGSSRLNLVVSLICESLVFVVIALGLAAVLVVIFDHTSYSNLISTPVLFNHHWGMTFITIGSAFMIAILSSLFPAIYVTSFNPALAIKGFIVTSSKGNAFRNGLIGFQFTISLILVICAIIINQQRNYLINHDLGFDKDNLLSVQISPTIFSKNELVETMLREDPSISDVTWADGPIVASKRMGWGRNLNGENIYFTVYPVAWNFLDFMKIPIVEGRDFTHFDSENENGLFILSETARSKFDIKLGERIPGHRGDDNPAEVIGFAKDFNYLPLTEMGDAFCFYQFGKNAWRPLKQLYVRTMPGADPFKVKEKIVDILSEIDPGKNKNLWDVELFNNSLEFLYANEKNISKIINLFTILAIIISLMGVFGLVMFDTEYRKKEIGIRKVNGASVKEILNMFNLKYIKIVVISFIIAAPLSWWIISEYLKSYAYRTPIYVWVFFVAFLAVLTVSIGVVTLRSYRSATANPVDSLKSE